MPLLPDLVRVFVGGTKEQKLAYHTLSNSIRGHTHSEVEIINLETVVPKTFFRANAESPTGFSYSRLAIPELCKWQGKAIYLDADMLVFSDIAELWNLSFPDGVSLLYSHQPKGLAAKSRYAVMLMDCEKLRFDIEAIHKSLVEGHHGYEDIIYNFCIIDSSAKRAIIPTAWNSLEHYSPEETKLLHYTKMPFQPWTYPHNPNGDLWYEALKDTLNAGNMTPSDVVDEIEAGHVFPGLASILNLSIPVKIRSGFCWVPPANRRPLSYYAGQNWMLAKLRRLVRDGIVLSSWFQYLLCLWSPKRYCVYDHPPQSPSYTQPGE